MCSPAKGRAGVWGAGSKRELFQARYPCRAGAVEPAPLCSDARREWAKCLAGVLQGQEGQLGGIPALLEALWHLQMHQLRVLGFS